MIEFRKGMTRGEVVDAMVVIETKEEAQAFFDAVVEATMEEMEESTVEKRQKALDLTSHNLGYFTGSSTQIDVELWESVGAVHPIFGKGPGMTVEETFKAAVERGRERGRGNR